jgi:hypothetical protein
MVMRAAQKAIETSAVEHGDARASRTWAAKPVREAVASPALALQIAIETAYRSAQARTAAEPEVPKWPGWARLAILLGAAGLSWTLFIAAAALLLRR